MRPIRSASHRHGCGHRTVRRAVGIVLAGLVATSCAAATTPDASGADVPATGDLGRGSTTVGSDATGSGDISGLVDIGGGRRVEVACRGTGSPTVVLVSGTGGAGDEWSLAASATDPAAPAAPSPTAVFPTTAAVTRVCVYDRPGTTRDGEAAGRSTPVAQPTTAPGAVGDLHAVLLAAGVTGPIVLVGHSWGGFIATTYARTFPADVAGLVLLDAASPHLRAALPPDEWAEWMALIDAQAVRDPASETPDYPASIAAVDGLGPVPPIPVSVLTADVPWDLLGRTGDETTWAAWLDAQARLSAELGATHITETASGHGIQIDNPALVHEQICAVLTPLRTC